MGGTTVRLIVATMCGLALAFLVAVSAFADGPARERAITIAVILLGYAVAGFGLSYRASAWYGPGIALPGVAALLLYAARGDGGWWIPAYAAAIVAVASAGGYAGMRGRGRTPSGPRPYPQLPNRSSDIHRSRRR